MPYIKPEDRPRGENMPSTVGELTYGLTRMCLDYLNERGPESFHNYAEVIAALECTKLELYRRQVSKYEDKKCLENGDVY